MYQFLETICIIEGKPRHLEWHQQRVDDTLRRFYPQHPHTWTLSDCIQVPEDLQTGKTRCRITYDAHYFSAHYDHYVSQPVNTLKIVEAPPGLEYSYKYADRAKLEALYAGKDGSDDILITREGWITDTSIANISFQKDDRWYTPFIPLLAGTTWKRLVQDRIIIPRPINLNELQTFAAFKTFNAMNSFDEAMVSSITGIR